VTSTEPAHLAGLVDRLLVHLADGTTDSAESTMSVPVADYLDPQRWEREVATIFRRSPVITALSAHLPEPGSYRSIDVAGVPVLTVRQPDGGVKAFVNVCRHRGALVVEHGCGEARRFTCPYHAWSYDTSGALVGVSGRQKFGDLDESTRGLTELACEERHGFVFAVLDPTVALDLDEWLAGYGAILEPLGLADMTLVDERELVGPNWKVAYDGYVDGYHLDILHRETLGKDVLGNVMTCDAWGPHQRISFARRTTHELADVAPEERDVIAHLALVVTVFPHVSVAGNTGNAVMVSQLFPGPTPDRSRTVQTHLVRAGADAEAREAALKRADFLEYVVTEEDYRTGLGIQSGLASGGNAEFLFGRNEPGNQHFHRWVARLADG
jgi:phenylpropionate dioxygenase-like ring-hydroxylating dioxygenase large terminal subunit